MNTRRKHIQALEQIIDSVEAIRRHPAPDPDALEANELLGSHYVRHLIVIGEAVARLSRSFRRTHDDVAWHKIVGMRNILVHEYEDIDWAEVFNTAQDDLPALKAHVEELRSELRRGRSR